MIKVQHIIAPYEYNKIYWAKRVAVMHKYLVDGIQLDPVFVSSIHCNITSGMYGIPERSLEYNRGQQSIMAAVAYFATDPNNELYVLLNDDGEPAPEVAAQARTWQTVRAEMGHDLNIFVGTWDQWLDRFI